MGRLITNQPVASLGEGSGEGTAQGDTIQGVTPEWKKKFGSWIYKHGRNDVGGWKFETTAKKGHHFGEGDD